jgi:hypothetical protein
MSPYDQCYEIVAVEFHGLSFVDNEFLRFSAKAKPEQDQRQDPAAESD